MTPVERLVQLIEEVSGNVLSRGDVSRFERVARERAALMRHADLAAYVRTLDGDRDSAEWRHLLSLITVNESYLYRAHQHFRALEQQVLPDLVERRSDRRLRLWSAGCARGEEAVSLAIVLAEYPALVGWDWSILASDVDEVALDEAGRGEYGQRAMAKVPTELVDRYFERLPESLYRLHRTLLARIQYRHLNLTDTRVLPDADPFDVVFLRNVLIYFRPETQRRVVLAVRDLMAQDGCLFLGPSESLWQLDTGLIAQDLGDCFCYRLPNALDSTDAASVPMRVPPPTAVAPTVKTGASPAVRRTAPVPDERELAAEIATSLSAGRLDEATERCARAVDRFPDSAELRALEGLAADLRGACDAARGSYRAALYLEPTLVQVRYLLARRLEQDGRDDRARAELRTILKTLADGTVALVPGWRELALPDPADLERRCRELLR